MAYGWHSPINVSKTVWSGGHREWRSDRADPRETQIQEEVAKFFAGFISVVFGFLLKENLLSPKTDPVKCTALYLAIGSFIASLAFSIATVFAYDRLLMPLALWQPPDLSRLRWKMMRAWQTLFLPSVAALGVGLLAVCAIVTTDVLITSFVWVIPIAAALVVYYQQGRDLNFVD